MYMNLMLFACILLLGDKLIGGPALIVIDRPRIQEIALASIISQHPDLTTNKLAFASILFNSPVGTQGSIMVVYTDLAGNVENASVLQTKPPLMKMDFHRIEDIAINAITNKQPSVKSDSLAFAGLIYELQSNNSDYIEIAYARNDASGHILKSSITNSTGMITTTKLTLNVRMSNLGAVEEVSAGSVVDYGLK